MRLRHTHCVAIVVCMCCAAFDGRYGVGVARPVRMLAAQPHTDGGQHRTHTARTVQVHRQRFAVAALVSIVLNAELGGAVLAVMYNNRHGVATLMSSNGEAVHVPAIFISLDNGQALVNALTATNATTNTLTTAQATLSIQGTGKCADDDWRALRDIMHDSLPTYIPRTSETENDDDNRDWYVELCHAQTTI